MVALAALALATGRAEEEAPRPFVAVGATKQDVLRVYGWPSGTAVTGTREILNYPQGQVILENGRVERVTFSKDVPWTPPRPKPPPPTASTRKPGAAATEPAAAEAAPAAPPPEAAPAAEPAPMPSVVEPVKPQPVEPAATVAAAPAVKAGARGADTGDTAVSPAAPALWSAWQLVVAALAVGALAAALVLLWVWRKPRTRKAKSTLIIADRIDAAAGGMPSIAEMRDWPREKLRAVVAALAESDGYLVHLRPLGGDMDVELRRKQEEKPRVLVCCLPGRDPVPMRRLRDVFGSLVADGVAQGWVVAPGGFGPEAAAYAESHRLALVNGDGLHALMREVPPVLLPAVLART
ncbi:restriction endonuclease [Opitutus sp. ER46]|uniref:restriction endonuclease n=1 Tax=Opitutus sp. ER46 TaxID=2161864 RepID=UPI000D3039D7|nr:restriction endonuclease [Opitutus sp. ER46]PTX97852.1 hypothetical protein DB354_06120 [Opitutus sp. ER46]